MEQKNNNFNEHNDILKNIRSKYLVIKIFEHLKQKKLLKMIEHNKKYQNIMNKNIEHYKIEFLKIEIEIFPKESTFGNFIRIPLNEGIQIFCNDDEKEAKKLNSIIKDVKVEKVKVIIDHKIESLSWLFYKCNDIKKINFIKFNRDNIKTMCGMFSGCTSL